MASNRWKSNVMTTVFREKKKAEFETYLRRMMNRLNKELLEETHKVCLFSTLVLKENGLFVVLIYDFLLFLISFLI